MERFVKIKFNEVVKCFIYRCKDNSLISSFSGVPGDVISVVVPEDCYLEFVPVSLFPIV